MPEVNQAFVPVLVDYAGTRHGSAGPKNKGRGVLAVCAMGGGSITMIEKYILIFRNPI
jgi:hypothetical protein